MTDLKNNRGQGGSKSLVPFFIPTVPPSHAQKFGFKGGIKAEIKRKEVIISQKTGLTEVVGVLKPEENQLLHLKKFKKEKK